MPKTKPASIADAARAYRDHSMDGWKTVDWSFDYWNSMVRNWLVWAFRAGALWERRRVKKASVDPKRVNIDVTLHRNHFVPLLGLVRLAKVDADRHHHREFANLLREIEYRIERERPRG